MTTKNFRLASIRLENKSTRGESIWRASTVADEVAIGHELAHRQASALAVSNVLAIDPQQASAQPVISQSKVGRRQSPCAEQIGGPAQSVSRLPTTAGLTQK